MAVTLQIKVNDKLYLRDPEATELGRKIIDTSIRLIEEIGFEAFTFKKLANEIGSTEASIYRYFENKHKLLIYLIAWYWSWIDYQIDYQTHNISDPVQRLRITIKVLSESAQYDPTFSHIDEKTLHRIVIAESSKAYLTKNVAEDNRDGFFMGYKSLSRKVGSIITEVAPDFKFPLAVSSTIIEAAHQQIYFAEHLPGLTELRVPDESKRQVAHFLETLVFTMIGRPECIGTE
jgi:AcrR family transcriptional regulator